MRALLVLAIASRVFAQEPREAAREEEKRACTPCHSLKLVHSQRLKPAAWGKEIDKMVGWGAIVPDRQLLLTYLSEEYSETKAGPAVYLSGNGAKAK
jgi:hypothetical protein